MNKVILDLCGGTGAWSKPYKDAGYDVRVVTMPKNDVRIFELPENVYGIFAAPPCTMFCRMRMCRGEPTSEQFIGALSVVDACLRTIVAAKPIFWALENPQGYLKRWLGEPQLKFNPCDYGDPWTKRTWIWGKFEEPKKNLVEPVGPLIHRKKGKRGVAKIDDENSVTPQGFAQAFYESNK